MDSIIEITHNHPHIIVFDGLCNLCNYSVDFIIKRDPKKTFKFLPLQNYRGILPEKFNEISNTESIIYIYKGTALFKSTAVLTICKRLSGLWPVLYLFIIIPPFFRNYIYDFIARNRYSFFGKRNSCRIPEPGIEERFLNS